ncbi:uncharacterized protein LOC103716775 [Phoenix dactylifera]|uniref:Uncharacterized protein LOC103716775 n=1 Tax=Phoenix dactylifera TaxID=42345 RepID=A0A8B9AQJ8_PHODC|nr:uncharacterized protein LOC103716775 [Phoenix dactylifera]
MSESEGPRHVEEGISPLHHGRDVANGHRSAPVTPTFASGFDFEDDHDHHHEKKSVLTKVKEKARKWRHVLAKKKHGHDNDNPTPPWGVSLDEEDDEQDPEYHGAPMYESETVPDAYKEGTSQHRSTAVQSPSALEKSVVFQHDNADKEPEMKQGDDMLEQPVLHHLDAIKETSCPHAKSLLHSPAAHQDPVGESGTDKTLAETVTGMLAPAYTMVSGATQMIASKIQSPGTGYESGAKQMYDKGISVREYLMHKLEPGEEDRALCQVITEAVSPRNAGQAQREVGVAEKVKEAVSSLLGREEVSRTETNPRAHQRPIQVPAINPCVQEASAPLSTNLHAHGSPIPVSRNLNVHESPILDSKNLQEHGPPIPVSTNPYAEEVEIDGRRLQAYTN